MQTAIITGGAGGMGLATAAILGRDHKVVIADVDRERLDAAADGLRAAGVDAQAEVCDITDRASVDALFAAAGPELRAVVHAAGVSPQMGSGAMIARINALGTVHIDTAALEVAGDGFAVVNVASIAGHMLPSALAPRRTYRLALTDPEAFSAKLESKARRPGSAYSVSKNFVLWYTRKMAAAFGAKGARVLSVSPGTFDTSMGRLEEKSGSGKLVEFAALKRFGRPEEVAELLAFCAGDKAGYLTGTDILIDGGAKAGLGLRGVIALARG
ncbi:SDR family oxidoreductase [Xylanimonas ulmi]|uniref:NAD(P)-dependent dehydrogenase (Short-subunit alcohol dehydrogenase family) n=1 Tax=Xylanimonas ulmi TaxID=228973 RepID=A0A4Q7M0V8_9MICO|nr:SDR family oxidoreductase [Xylanibacterium ulmi]RZS60533.1 NAD(P)-dependent dehydrogenase (short-subunit alcohol dehydrogenase family) [Xylanibacterium ulmi]